MPKKTIGIVVDGHGDYASINRRFKGRFKVLKTDGPRGHTVSVEDFAQGARKQVNMLSFFGCESALIVTDFEERPENYSCFVAKLRAMFARSGFPIPVSVVVSNKMIENWYLADIVYLSKQKNYLRENLKQKNYEGKNGKKELKRLFKNGVYYNEVKHGPELFEILRIPVALANSPSFKEFVGFAGCQCY